MKLASFGLSLILIFVKIHSIQIYANMYFGLGT